MRALALAAGVTAPLAAQEVAYEGGLSAATGRYIFTERTTTWTLLAGLAYTAGRFTLRGSVPIVLQNTTLVTRSGMGGGAERWIFEWQRVAAWQRPSGKRVDRGERGGNVRPHVPRR